MRIRYFPGIALIPLPNLLDQVGREALRTSHWGEGPVWAFSIRLFACIKAYGQPARALCSATEAAR